MGRSMLAITIGYVFSALLVITTFLIVGQVTQSLVIGEGANPALLNNILIGVQFFSLLYAVAGGYITARLVKKNKVQHGLMLGVVMVAIAVLSSLVETGNMTQWWYVLFLLLVIPSTTLGGWLNTAKKRV